MVNHQNNIVKKPWGYEYLVYQNEEVALWYLHVKAGESTSMHCHPKKTTGLILLNGEAELCFLADSRKLKGLAKVMIRRGLFHQTKAITDIDMFEIETPNDKGDLVRLKDNYGRENKAYEGEEFETPKTQNCYEINELTETGFKQFSKCLIWVTKLNRLNDIKDIEDGEVVVFLKGGMVRKIEGEDHLVTIPGDVGHGQILKQIAPHLDGVQDPTYVMLISKV